MENIKASKGADIVGHLLSIFESDDGSLLRMYLQAEVKKVDEKFEFDEIFEPIFSIDRWMGLLHALPQDFIQQIRQLNCGEHFEDGIFGSIQGLDFGKHFVGEFSVQLLPTKAGCTGARKVKSRRLLCPIVVKAILGVKRDRYDLNIESSFAEYNILMARVRKAADVSTPPKEKCNLIDMYRFMLDPYRLTMNMRTKLLETAISGMKILIDSLPSIQNFMLSSSLSGSKSPSRKQGSTDAAEQRQQEMLQRLRRIGEVVPALTSYVMSLHASLPYSDRALDSDSIDGIDLT